MAHAYIHHSFIHARTRDTSSDIYRVFFFFIFAFLRTWCGMVVDDLMSCFQNILFEWGVTYVRTTIGSCSDDVDESDEMAE
jgi:hypothetical protein